jgi:hypothetical protein
VGIATSVVLRNYHRSLIEWGEECDRASEGDPSRGLHEFAMAEAYFELLRDDPDGRIGIDTLREDANPYVRVMAAVHSLLWASDEAVPVIEAIERSAAAPERLKRTAQAFLDAWRADALSVGASWLHD